MLSINCYMLIIDKIKEHIDYIRLIVIQTLYVLFKP